MATTAYKAHCAPIASPIIELQALWLNASRLGTASMEAGRPYEHHEREAAALRRMIMTSEPSKLEEVKIVADHLYVCAEILDECVHMDQPADVFRAAALTVADHLTILATREG